VLVRASAAFDDDLTLMAAASPTLGSNALRGLVSEVGTGGMDHQCRVAHPHPLTSLRTDTSPQ
jgi:hypothetical protein